MSNTLQTLLQSAREAISQAADISALEQLRVSYLGKKGLLTELLKTVASMPPAERSTIGKAINAAKQELHALIETQLEKLQSQALETQLSKDTVDVTLRGRFDSPGSLHPMTQVSERVIALFTALGFTVAEGPEIEDDYHNFAALNIPPDHPARAMQDTFYLGKPALHQLLRTHTSPVQIRTMEQSGVPIRLITLGRVYRRDFDATHTPMFHQLEGLVVDEHCTFSDLKGLLQHFLNQFFETEITLRFRPSYFPFTEPSAEVDFYQPLTQKWLEILGCGMVHPNVLRNVGVNPEKYSGFAFGVGLDRLAMLRYGVPDLRLLFENDLRFLEQF